MDEQEQADRMAAAEALFMISGVAKAKVTDKTSKRGRKKSIINELEIKPKGENISANPCRRGRGRGRGSGQKNRGRGRGGKTNASPRGRGSSTGRGRKQTNEKKTLNESPNYLTNYDTQQDFNDSLSVSHFETIATEGLTSKKNSKAKVPKATKQREQRKSSQLSNNSSKSPMGAGSLHNEEPAINQALGFTGVTISIPELTNRRSSVETTHNNVLGSFSTLKQQLNLGSKNFGASASLASLPPMNLLSLPTDSIANLPSIPLEIESLRLSSQPTPNLSSLSDLNSESVMDYEDIVDDREKSEKFLPLKKRKLHNPAPTSSSANNVPTIAMDTSPDTDSEDTYEVESPAAQSSQPPTPPIRSSFTVQAPPIITMQTLMEIKTALSADEDGDLPLHIAVVHNNMRMVKKLINLMKIVGRGVDKFNKQQQTPLHLAVKLDFLDAVDILLKNGASVNAVDCTGSSAIHMAVQMRSAKCLQLLLDRCPDAELNSRNFEGLTPLHTAVDNGDLELVEMLLKHGADIDFTDGKSGRTCLFRAAENNEKAMVELLLRHGANPEVPNYAGVTTAMAVQGRNLHGVLKLLGSVPTDKFTDAEMKPFGQESSNHLGQPTEEIDQHKQSSLEVKSEVANETKVFQNVFVVSQKSDMDCDPHWKSSQASKCRSEPSSPDVKMEVYEDGDQLAFRGQGLLSLPDRIFRLGETSSATPSALKSNRPQSCRPDQEPTRSSLGQLTSVTTAVTDTISLTSNQARLYQKLLEMYNIEAPGIPASSNKTSMPVGQVSSPTLQSSPAAFTRTSVVDEVQFMTQKQPLLQSSPSQGRSTVFVVNRSGPLGVDRPVQSSGVLQMTSQPLKTEVTVPASPSDTPLNLSKPALGASGKPEKHFDQPSANQRGGVISVRKVSGSEKTGQVPESPGGEYKMVLVPVSGQQVAIQNKTVNSTAGSLAKESGTPRVSLPVPQNGSEPASTTKLVSQKTALLVRDFLNKQQRASSPLISASSVMSSLSTAGQSRQMVTISGPLPSDSSSISSRLSTSSIAPSTISGASMASPLLSQEGRAIDLRLNSDRRTITPQSFKTFLTSPVLFTKSNTEYVRQQPDLSQGKIVGFSGAIISVAPTKMKDKPEAMVIEKVETPKIKENLPKEQKKRGRKPNKVAQEVVAASEMTLSKVHSDTDEKLRQFLGAKRSEMTPTVLEDSEKTKTVENNIGRSPADSTYKTVGIFSGNVQHVRIGKTYSPSVATSK